MACGTYVRLSGACGHKECLRPLPFKGWCLGRAHPTCGTSPRQAACSRATVSGSARRGLQSLGRLHGRPTGEATAAGPGGPSCRACCLWLWGPRRSDLLQPSSAPSARPAAWGAAWNGESKGDTTDGAGPELGDLRLIALTWSPVVWGSGETGAAGLVETPFFSFALPAFPEEAHAPYTQAQVESQ